MSQKQHELTERVKRELEPGEKLLYCEQPSAGNIISGIIFMLMGGVFLFFGVMVTAFFILENPLMVIVSVLICLPLGLLSASEGYKRAFSSGSKYNFVTDKRLCIRALNSSHKDANKDILLSDIKNLVFDRGRGNRGGDFSSINITMHNNTYFYFHPWNHIKMNEALSSAVNRSEQGADANGL